MSIAGLEPHPLAEAFPVWADESFMNDIRDHGVRIPIVLYEGKILDGRNRVAAAKRAGQTKIIYTGFEGSFEQARRHLNESRPPPSRHRARP